MSDVRLGYLSDFLQTVSYSVKSIYHFNLGLSQSYKSRAEPEAHEGNMQCCFSFQFQFERIQLTRSMIFFIP